MAAPTPVYPPLPQSSLDAWAWAGWIRQPAVGPTRPPTETVFTCLANTPGAPTRRSFTNANPPSHTYN